MLDLSKVKYEPLHKRAKHTIETGFIDYDRHVFDLKLSEITIIFGRNGEGKTTVVSQIAGHHLSKGKRLYLYSGELGKNKIQEWLYRQIIGTDLKYYNKVTTKYGIKYDFKPNIVDMVKKWHDSRLYIYNMKLDKICKDTAKLFADMKKAKELGVDLFLIDNLMTAFEINERTQYSDQANFVQACKDFARDNNVHVIIVAHPNKSQSELDFKATAGNLAKNDVSGSGNISNKADNVIAVERVWKTKGIDYEESVPDAYISSLKDREDGIRAVFRYKFCHESLRFYNSNTPKHVYYDWKNEGKQGDLPF